MLTINSKSVAAAEPTAATLAEEFQGLTYLELRQDYGYEIHRVAALTTEDDRLLAAVSPSLTISLSISAHNKCWRLWHKFPSLEERRGRYWR